MDALQELIETADKFCENLSRQAGIEIKFYNDVSEVLERMAWEVYCIRNNLKQIQQYKGV